MAELESTAPTPEVDTNTSFDDKLAAKLGLNEPAPATKEAPAVDETAPSDELQPEEIAEETPSSGDDFEITHNGARIKVSKEEAKKYAEQGYDYTRKASAIAEERKALEQQKAALQERAKITPDVVNALAAVRMHEQALQQYQNFDWGKHAQDDPIGYIATRARYDQLREGLQQAHQQGQQASQKAAQADQQITAAQLSQELAKFLEKAPDLRDPQKYTAEAKKIREYMAQEGYSDDEANGLTNARYLLTLRKAMKYDAAMAARAEKVKTTPTLTPGAAPQRQSAATKEAETIKALHRAKPGSEAKKSLLDSALAAKLARMA